MRVRVFVVMIACAGMAALAAGQAPQRQAHATLNQLMRSVLFPNSNVIFAAQALDPTTVKPAADPALATDPFTGIYSGWQAVENAGLALAESANLLTVPGRVCSNGRPVPIDDPDWPTFVQGLRDAGMTAFKAAQSQDQLQILDAADAMTTACANCHDKWREVPAADRCM